MPLHAPGADPSAEHDEAALMHHVDRHPGVAWATEPDEEQILRSLYGEPVQGIYGGTGEAS